MRGVRRHAGGGAWPDSSPAPAAPRRRRFRGSSWPRRPHGALPLPPGPARVPCGGCGAVLAVPRGMPPASLRARSAAPRSTATAANALLPTAAASRSLQRHRGCRRCVARAGCTARFSGWGFGCKCMSIYKKMSDYIIVNFVLIAGKCARTEGLHFISAKFLENFCRHCGDCCH